MDDELLAAQSIIDEFRQALADTQFLLAKANALIKVKDRRISALETTQAPKPGPPST